MRLRNAAVSGLLLVVCAACRAEPEAILPVEPPSEMMQAPPVPAAITLPKKVMATRDELLIFANAGSLGGLSDIAKRKEGFVSNFGGQDHRQFWDLMRRTGLDPNLKLRQLFDLPPGVREIDGQRWYIWPDLAAKDAADLIPEALSFEDRRRLEDLIHADGIAKIRAGEGYPGMRTAISEDGTWRYFVLGLDGEE